MQILKENPYFYTATILGWKPLLESDIMKDIIINSFRYMTACNRIKIFAFVIMNNHIHTIWQSATGYTYKGNQHSFMKYTAQQMIKLMRNNHLGTLLSEYEVNAKDRKYQIWERNALSIELFSPNVFEQKMEYIHQNPVKASICYSAEDYKYSSAGYYTNNNTDWDFLSSIYE